MKKITVFIFLFTIQNIFCQIIEKSKLFQDFKLTSNEKFIDVFKSNDTYFYYSFSRDTIKNTQAFSKLMDSNGITYNLNANESVVHIFNNRLFTVKSRKNSIDEYDVTQIYTVYKLRTGNKQLKKIKSIEFYGFPYVKFLTNGSIIVNGGGCVEGCTEYGFSNLYNTNFKLIQKFIKETPDYFTEIVNTFSNDYIINVFQRENKKNAIIEVYDIKTKTIVNSKPLKNLNLIKFGCETYITNNEILIIFYNFKLKNREILVLDKNSLKEINKVYLKNRVYDKMVVVNNVIYYRDQAKMYAFDNKFLQEKWHVALINSQLNSENNKSSEFKYAKVFSLKNKYILNIEYAIHSNSKGQKEVYIQIFDVDKRKNIQEIKVTKFPYDSNNNFEVKILGDYLFLYTDTNVKSYRVN